MGLQIDTILARNGDNRLAQLRETPGLLALLPLLYVAWADTVLTPSEIEIIRSNAFEGDWMNEAERALLQSWLDPKKPPSDEVMRSWSQIIRSAGQQVTAEPVETAVDYGLALLECQYPEVHSRWSRRSAYQALRGMEASLGILGLDAYSNIFPKSMQLPEEQKAAPFSTQGLQAILDGKYAPTKNKMRALLSDPAFRIRHFQNKHEYRAQTLEWCKLLADQGIGALAYPKEYGGGGDIGEYMAAFDIMGHHDISLLIKFGVQFGLFGGSVAQLGSEKHHKKYLADIGKLKVSGCFAMSEVGHGSNVNDAETTATYDSDKQEFIVHTPRPGASKYWIGNALHGHMATVFAQLIVDGEGQGVHAFLVPTRDDAGDLLPGVIVRDIGYKMGLNGVDNGQLIFDQVRIPLDNLLDRFASVSTDGKYSSPIKSQSRRFFTMLGTLVGGRVGVPRGGLSAAKTALTVAIRYALKRRQFGDRNQPETLLLDYTTHQKRLMPLLAKSYALHFALDELTNRFTSMTEESAREVEVFAAGLKSYSTWFTTNCIQECREACGGQGYLWRNRFADLKADTDVFMTFEGDNTVLMQLVAKGMLTKFKEEFSGAGVFGVLRILSEQASATLQEYNPFSNRNSDQEHLRDFEFHKAAFEYRERHLLLKVSQRMRKRLKRGMSAYDAYIRCQDHLLMMAEAHIENRVLQIFVDKVNAIEDPSIRKTMTTAQNLYALSTLEKHKGWYLEQGYMEGAKTKAIRSQVNLLCYEMRQIAAPLCDSFGIPEASIAAPIAFKEDDELAGQAVNRMA